VKSAFGCFRFIVEQLFVRGDEETFFALSGVRTVRLSAFAVHTYSVSNLVGMARIFGLETINNVFIVKDESPT
jgi:hypothetical protein